MAGPDAKMLNSLLVLSMLAACGPSPVPEPPGAGPIPTAEPAAPPVALASASSTAEPAAAPRPGPSPTTPPQPAWPEVAFPPPKVTPPSTKSAAEGDGEWSRLGSPGERIAEGEPTMFKTVVHPHPVSRFITVTVVAIDLARVEPFWVPGTDDPKLDQLPAAVTPGLIPAAHHDRLLVVTNGGFAPRHGKWGMGVAGVSLVEPREGGCTVAIDDDGRMTIAPSSEVTDLAELRVWRQTPPCLLDDGALHPDLERGQLRIWAGRDPGRKTRRRSALGLDATGRILFYGMGVETEADDLARGMAAVGAENAVELDINYSWTKFLVFGGEPLKVTSTLIEDMKHSTRGYVEKSAFRDFFYLLRR